MPMAFVPLITEKKTLFIWQSLARAVPKKPSFQTKTAYSVQPSSAQASAVCCINHMNEPFLFGATSFQVTQQQYQQKTIEHHT